MKKIVLSAMLLCGMMMQAQHKNSLLEQNFWRNQPTLDLVKSEIQKGNDPSQSNANEMDVVTLAINNDAPADVIKFLVDQKGNEVTKAGNHKRTYLHWATAKGNVSVIDYLLQKGSDINARDTHDFTPLIYGINSGLNNPAVYELFAKAGEDLTQKNNSGATFMMMAIASDVNFAVTDYLIKKVLS